MIRVDVRYSDHVEWVKITGDFFLHPEETLEEIEGCLVAAALPLDQQALSDCIARCLARSQAELIGAAPADFVSVLQEAVG